MWYVWFSWFNPPENMSWLKQNPLCGFVIHTAGLIYAILFEVISKHCANSRPIAGITNRYYFFGKKVIGKKSICDCAADLLYHFASAPFKEWWYYNTGFAEGQQHFCPKNTRAESGELQHVLQKFTNTGERRPEIRRRTISLRHEKSSVVSHRAFAHVIC